MTTMLERCRAASETVSQVTTARKLQHVRARLEQRTQEWTERRSKLLASRGRSEWVQVRPSEVAAFVQRRDQLAIHAKEAVSRLSGGEDVSALTEDPLWTKLLKSAEGAADSLEEAIRDAWRGIVEGAGTLEEPSALEATLPQTPANKQALDGYRAKYRDYRKLAGQAAPRSATDSENLEHAVRECRSALATVQRDVPKEVDEFFRAVDAYTATLAHVTPNVLRWLEDNGQLVRYQVRIAAK